MRTFARGTRRALEDLLLACGAGGCVQPASRQVPTGRLRALWLVRLRGPSGAEFESTFHLPTCGRRWIVGAEEPMRCVGVRGVRAGAVFVLARVGPSAWPIALRYSVPEPPDLAEAVEVLGERALCALRWRDFARWCNATGHDPTSPPARDQFRECARCVRGLWATVGEGGLRGLVVHVARLGNVP